MPLEVLVKHWQADYGWDIDKIRLLEHQRAIGLTAQIVKYGIESVGEVVLGADGKVWDGKHRIAICLELGIPEIPFVFKDISDELFNLVKQYQK